MFRNVSVTSCRYMHAFNMFLVVQESAYSNIVSVRWHSIPSKDDWGVVSVLEFTEEVILKVALEKELLVSQLAEVQQDAADADALRKQQREDPTVTRGGWAERTAQVFRKDMI